MKLLLLVMLLFAACAPKLCPDHAQWDTNMGRCRANHDGKLWEFVKDECCR